MKQTKLSKQQKEILNFLHKQEYKNAVTGYLSKRIAIKRGKIEDRYHALVDDNTYSASISRSTKRLKERGLIEKRNYRFIKLTDKGLKFCESKFKNNG